MTYSLMLISGDISPEELFNMFFGGGFPSGEFLHHIFAAFV